MIKACNKKANNQKAKPNPQTKAKARSKCKS